MKIEQKLSTIEGALAIYSSKFKLQKICQTSHCCDVCACSWALNDKRAIGVTIGLEDNDVVCARQRVEELGLLRTDNALAGVDIDVSNKVQASAGFGSSVVFSRPISIKRRLKKKCER